MVAAAAVGMITVAGCSSTPRLDGLTAQVDGMDVHYLASEPASASASAGTVLFLHGASFNADVWEKLGLLDEVAEWGCHAVAIDMPGYGESSDLTQSTDDFLASAVAQFGDGKPVVVVSPSRSGDFSLPYVARNPDDLAGLVAIAPVGVDEMANGVRDPLTTPALIVWGEDDDVIDIADADTLAAQFTDAQVEIIEDAGHSAYQDRPEEFATLLHDFLDKTALCA